MPYNGKWEVRGARNEKVRSIHNTQKEAINAAQQIAQNQQSEVVIHRPDGTIRDKDSYGSDPKSSQGQKNS